MLRENLVLHIPALAVERIDQIEVDIAAGEVIPDLYQMHLYAVRKQDGIIEIEAFSVPDDLIPVPKIDVEPTAGTEQRVHLTQDARNIRILHIRKRIAGRGGAVELPPGEHRVERAKIAGGKLR